MHDHHPPFPLSALLAFLFIERTPTHTALVTQNDLVASVASHAQETYRRQVVTDGAPSQQELAARHNKPPTSTRPQAAALKTCYPLPSLTRNYYPFPGPSARGEK